MSLIPSTCFKISEKQQLSWLNLPDQGASGRTFRKGFLFARSAFSGSLTDACRIDPAHSVGEQQRGARNNIVT
jgi:hypothetical protein